MLKWVFEKKDELPEDINKCDVYMAVVSTNYPEPDRVCDTFAEAVALAKSDHTFSPQDKVSILVLLGDRVQFTVLREIVCYEFDADLPNDVDLSQHSDWDGEKWVKTV